MTYPDGKQNYLLYIRKEYIIARQQQTAFIRAMLCDSSCFHSSRPYLIGGQRPVTSSGCFLSNAVEKKGKR